MRSDFAFLDFNLPWWAALLVFLAVLLPMARFCYAHARTQAAAPRVVLTAIRSLYTAILLLLALDATVTLTRTAGSELHIIRLEPAPPIDEVARDHRLNERFQVNLISKALADLRHHLTGTSNGSDVAAVVIAASSTDEAAEAVDLVKRRFAAPLFVALDTRSAAIPDVSVISATADGRAALGVQTTIRATVRGRNMAGRRTVVELRDEVRTLASATLDWKTDVESAVVPLHFAPAVEGVHRYVIRAGQDENEAVADDNELRFSLDVSRVERRILFIENQPTWEGKFIRRALQDDGQLKVDYYAQISREAALAQPSTDAGRDVRRILADFRVLAGYDAIIAGPVDASYFSALEARNISEFVERRGGGLIILGSNDFSGSIISPSSPLAHLAPADVSFTSRAAEEGGRSTTMVPTEEGIAEGLFYSRTAGIALEELGPISTQYLKVKSLKPGASAFARDGSVTGDSSPVLLAGQAYGLGRVLLVAPGDLWREMLAQSGEQQSQFVTFWRNVAFWAAGNAEPPSYIRLVEDSLVAGRPITAYLTARDEGFNPLNGLIIEAGIEFSQRGGESEPEHIPVVVEPVRGSPGVYKLSSEGLEEGGGAFAVTVRGKGIKSQNLRLGFDVQPGERARPVSPGGQDRLYQAARESGGEVFTSQETGSMVDALMKLPTVSSRVQSVFRLRDGLVLAFLLPLLMAAEYFLRHRFSTESRES